MSTARSASTETSQPPVIDNVEWTKHLPYLFSIRSPSIAVRQTTHESQKTKDTNLLLITRTDGIHKIGHLPNDERDTRLADGTEARKAYLCRVGGILSAKAGISGGGNKASDVVWDALPDVLFGYEIFERTRDKAAANRASDVYVVGHPIEGSVEGLFRTPEEFAQHLLWLAEGDDKKECICVLCTKEARRKIRKITCVSKEETAEAWKQECKDRAKSYLSSTTLGSFWGDLPQLNGQEDDL